MNRDRLVQLVALLVAIGCLVGATTLTAPIREQREELNLTFTVDGDGGQPPKYALTAAAMGSFRGIVVDILWYRIEHFKREGKIHEANTLASWITTLQPRFAQVWIFQAWNMAYNISVMTHTPEERWMWVRKGIDLLRDEGIPNNPTVVGIYDQIGWIFFHKIGQNLDDHHWYYKEQLAREWQILLGAQRRGRTAEEVVAAFEPIAEAADRYFQLDMPSRAARRTMYDLTEAHPGVAETIQGMWDDDITRFIEKVQRAQATLREQGRPAVASELDPLVPAARERIARSRNAPLRLFQEEAPEAANLLEPWRELALRLDKASLQTFGEMKMYADRLSARELIERQPEFLSESDLAILRFIDEHEDSPALADFLAYLRAKVLIQDYKMNPRYMHELMEEFGPIDWRHHASHALYWYLLGMRRGDVAGNADRFDLLRVHRQAKNSLQDLVFYGRLNYDPFARSVSYAPDPGYFDAFEQMTESAIQRVLENEEYSPSTTGFESAHENLLQKLVLYSYIYGNEEQARKYYTKVRRLYNDKPFNQRTGRYDQPLADFVAHVMARDRGMMQVSPVFIEAMVERGLREGLAQGRLGVFEKYLNLARQMHRQWHEERGWEKPNTVRSGRLMLRPFDEELVGIYAEFMSSTNISLYERMQVYRNTPGSLQRQAYPEFRNAVQRQAAQQGFDASLAFPPPSEVDDSAPIEVRRPEDAAADTVERN
ncbi:MAG: hypothetical protein ACODAQ_06050 [Phycisphaeraceae bacterium]